MSLELGSATGRFTQALGITEGIEPSVPMDELAERRGVRTLGGVAESLPYQDNQFDVVLSNCSISYFEKPVLALREEYRVLKPGGCIIITFIDRISRLGNS